MRWDLVWSEKDKGIVKHMVAYIFPKSHRRLICPDLLRHFAVFKKIGGF
jgi:hypothetical protein